MKILTPDRKTVISGSSDHTHYQNLEFSNRKKKVNSASVKRENQENIREFIRKKRTAKTQSLQRNIIDFINEDEDNFIILCMCSRF
jgi:hypothetical protein